MPYFFVVRVALNATKEGGDMKESNKEPNGCELLATLIRLLEEQEGVKIECVYERKKTNDLQTLQTC